MIRNMIFILSVAFLIIPSNSLAEKEEIIWLTADFPPYSIISGTYREMGCVDHIQKVVKNYLKEYTHINVVANSRRIFHELKLKNRIIYASALKTKEREKYILYSLPYAIVLPNNLIILKSSFSRIKPFIDNGEVDLEKMIKGSEVVVGQSVGRAYEPFINSLLQRNRKNPNIKTYYRNYFKSSFTDMLKGYIDSTIGYPMEAQYFLKVLKSDRSIMAIPVKGTFKYILGYFALPRTSWGEKTVKRINSIIKDQKNFTEFHKIYEYWLDDRSVKLYRQYTKEVFGKSTESR